MTRMYEAMSNGDWTAVASLMHPEALGVVHRTMETLVSSDASGQVASQLFQLKAGEGFASLSSEAVFSRWMGAVETLTPGLSQLLRTSTVVVLGSVVEGDVVHVVIRQTMSLEGTQVSKVAVVPMKLHNSEWRGLLTGDLEVMVAKLQRPRNE